MEPTLRTVVAAVGAVTALGLTSCGSQATGEDYPSGNVTFLVPFSAGGPTDITSRAVSECLSEELGQSVVVENQDGGGGSRAMQQIISAEPDGYTVGLASLGSLVMTPLANGLDYSKDDVTPIGQIAEVPSYIVVGEDSPYDSAENLFAEARENPGGLKFAVSSATGPQAIELQRMRDDYGVDITAVPFDGNTEQTTALLGGDVDGVFINDGPDVESRLDDGSFKPLAVSSAERTDFLPDVPTLVELGFDDLTGAVSSYGFVGPADLPDAVSTKLSDGLETCRQSEDVISQIGERFITDEYVDGESLQKIHDEAYALYEPILSSQ